MLWGQGRAGPLPPYDQQLRVHAMLLGAGAALGMAMYVGAAWHTQAAVTFMWYWLLLQQLPQSTGCTCQPDFQRALLCYFNAATAAAVLPSVLS